MIEPKLAAWTLEELERNVRESLLAAGHAGVDSGRVRDVPDQRAIRYYATLGLLDRPSAYRGRTALYGVRHLLQLTAIKRLQAQGQSLVRIQQELLGASTAALAKLSGLEADTIADKPIAARSPEPAPQLINGESLERRAKRFWSEPAAEVPNRADPRTQPVSTFQGVDLGDSASLLLKPRRELDDEDLRVIRMAAAPLLELLAMRGLIERPLENSGPNESYTSC